jgi:hypothetical protein
MCAVPSMAVFLLPWFLAFLVFSEWFLDSSIFSVIIGIIFIFTFYIIVVVVVVSIPVAVRPKPYIWSRLTDGIAGMNSAKGMDVRLLCL